MNETLEAWTIATDMLQSGDAASVIMLICEIEFPMVANLRGLSEFVVDHVFCIAVDYGHQPTLNQRLRIMEQPVEVVTTEAAREWLGTVRENGDG